MKISSFVRLIKIGLMRVIIRLLHVFKINPKRIIFNSYRGNQYSCSPKYISEYLLSRNEGWEIIWAFIHPSEYEWLKEEGVKTVKYYSLQRFFYEATAYASINNVGSFSWIPLRKMQKHINTWHGGGCYKRVALGEAKNDTLFKKSLLMNSDETTHFISSSKFFSENIIPNEFGYKGKILEIGLPRNDIFFDECKIKKAKSKIVKMYSIDQNKYIILYAPTWRYSKSDKPILPEFEKIQAAIKQKYHKESEILIRPHPISKVEYSGYLSVKDYPDMQELLCAADMLITDYSSCIWDYALLKRPCYLFIPDECEYSTARGFYKSVYEWGVPTVKNTEELVNSIISISDDDMAIKMQGHLDLLGSYENGSALEKFYYHLKQY